MRFFGFFILVLFICIGCKHKKKKEQQDNSEYVSIVSFLRGQAKMLDTSLYSFTKIVTIDGKSDTTPLRRESVRGLAEDFLNIPDLRSDEGKLYKEMNYLDSATQMGSMTYWNEGSEVPKQQIYFIKSGSNFDDVIKTVYIEKEVAKGDSVVAKRLIWDVVYRYFQVRTITTKKDSPEKVSDMKVVWEDVLHN